MVLLPGLLAAGIAQAACLSIVTYPDGAPLASLAIAREEADFRLTYRHSVTRTPVEERYRVDGDAIVETEIRFEQHGPGLPSEPDAGERWMQRDGQIIVTMHRRFPRMVMRVHADSQPMLTTAARTIELAQWGNRALELKIVAEPCVLP